MFKKNHGLLSGKTNS